MLIYFVVVVSIFYTVHEKLGIFFTYVEENLPQVIDICVSHLIRPICDVIESIMSTRKAMCDGTIVKREESGRS